MPPSAVENRPAPMWEALSQRRPEVRIKIAARVSADTRAAPQILLSRGSSPRPGNSSENRPCSADLCFQEVCGFGVGDEKPQAARSRSALQIFVNRSASQRHCNSFVHPGSAQGGGSRSARLVRAHYSAPERRTLALLALSWTKQLSGRNQKFDSTAFGFAAATRSDTR